MRTVTYKPAFPAFALVAGLAPVTWLFSSTLGYLLSAAFVASFLAYRPVFSFSVTSRRMRILIALLLTYWVLLIVQFLVTGTLTFLPYIVLTPISIVSLVVIAPRFVHADRTTYAAGIASIVLSLTLIGFLLLAVHHAFGLSFPWTGHQALGEYPWRISSLYGNSNHYGFVAAVGLLAALYLSLETRRRLWMAVAAVVFVGLVLSNARTALVAGSLGAVVLLIRTDLRLGVAGVLGAVVAVLVASRFPFFDVYIEFAWTSLMGRLAAWRVVWAEAMANPFIGEGFDTGLVVHNSYLSIVLHTGIGAAVLYLLAMWFSFAQAGLKAITGGLWESYLFATLLLITIQLVTETATFSGLSTESLLLGIYMGLAVYPRTDTDERP